MGLILKFEPGRRQTRPGGAERQGPAAVLFFTGVRYERHAAVAKPRRARKRKPTGGKRTA